MSDAEAIFLGFVIVAMAVFVVVLAWGDYYSSRR